MLGLRDAGMPANAGMLGSHDPTIPGFRSQDAGMPGCQDAVIPGSGALRMRPGTKKTLKGVCFGLPSALRMRPGALRLTPSTLRLMRGRGGGEEAFGLISEAGPIYRGSIGDPRLADRLVRRLDGAAGACPDTCPAASPGPMAVE